MTVDTIKISPKLKEALERENIKSLTKVQKAVLGPCLENKDIIVQSETGSGKTLAYLIPIFEKYKEKVKTNQVIILVPTHELAMQVYRQSELLAANSGIDIQSAVIMGDVNIERQIKKLKEKPQIIIGTSGRILELIKKKKIAAHTVKTIIIDEADRLLNKDNIGMTQAVVKCTMKDRQLLFFSASMVQKAVEAARVMSKEPVIIKINSKEKIPDNIKHMYLISERRDKLENFRKAAFILKPKKAMVFINKMSDIEEATSKLVYHKMKAECLHGSIIKSDRKRVIDEFKKNQITYLIATDIAARGLHFSDVDMVFHLTVPEDISEYLHRAGRTGRNGKRGANLLIITKEELPLLKKIEKKFGLSITQMKMNNGKLVEVYKNRIKH